MEQPTYHILMSDEQHFAIEWAFRVTNYHAGDCLVKVVMPQNIDMVSVEEVSEEEAEEHPDYYFHSMLDPMSMGECRNYIVKNIDKFESVYDVRGLYLIDADDVLVFAEPIEIRNQPIVEPTEVSMIEESETLPMEETDESY